MTATGVVRLGLGANAARFALLVGLNAPVGAMLGLERRVLPLVSEQDFGLRSSTATAIVAALTAASGLVVAATGRQSQP